MTTMTYSEPFKGELNGRPATFRQVFEWEDGECVDAYVSVVHFDDYR